MTQELQPFEDRFFDDPEGEQRFLLKVNGDVMISTKAGWKRLTHSDGTPVRQNEIEIPHA